MLNGFAKNKARRKLVLLKYNIGKQNLIVEIQYMLFFLSVYTCRCGVYFKETAEQHNN